jgi:hypothetical protein
MISVKFDRLIQLKPKRTNFSAHTESAYERFQSLVGLAETKKTILQSIQLLRLQYLRKKQNSKCRIA